MASLNWAVLDSNTLVPVPLPREKVLLSLASVTLALAPSSPPPASARSTARPIEYKVEKGTVYLSNQRVVYVAPPNLAAQDATAASSGSTTLETLSCPYTHFQDGRLNQPFFGANNFEAVILPARQGGLSVRLFPPLCGFDSCGISLRLPPDTVQGPHTVRLYFKEGGGFDFYSTVLEMKERLASAPRSAGPSAAGEDLRECLDLTAAHSREV